MGLQLGLSFRLLPVRVQVERGNAGMSPESRETLLHTHLFPHQISAFNVLLACAQTYFRGHWRSLPIKTRWHGMLLGPTGVGKTELAKMVARATDAALLQISVPSWMPSGAHDRATAQTLPLVLRHIDLHPRSILFLDEIDKAHASGTQSGGSHFHSPWMGFVRSELYELLDGRWPTGIKFDRDTDEEEEGASSSEHLTGEKLRNSTFVLAAGTFQSFYDRKPPKSIGFHEPHQDGQTPAAPSFDTIVEMMPRELSNRFGHFITLPELTPPDYHHLARQAEINLPEWIVPTFRDAVSRRLPQAIASKAGCRFVELALAEALQTWQQHLPQRPIPPNPLL